jgi:hypothetical protein
MVEKEFIPTDRRTVEVLGRVLVEAGGVRASGAGALD